MNFGATLRLLRMNSGWTLRDLATRLGVSNTYLSRVENGHDAPPTPDRLAELAVLFGLSPTKLVELADAVSPAAPSYLARFPPARDLFLEIVRRELSSVDLARVRAFVEREFPLPNGSVEARTIARMVAPERVMLNVACQELGDVIDLAASKLATPNLRAASLADAIRGHERDCSTAVGAGLALPYALVPDAPPAAVLVTLRAPMFASTPDDKPLRVILVHTHPGPPDHTRLLVQLVNAAKEETVQALCRARDPAAALTTFHERVASGA